MNNHRILVTGANGFVGAHLCRHLQKLGFVVRAAVRRQPEAGFPADEITIVSEISNQGAWDIALRDVDYVVHLAALAHQIGKPVSFKHFRRINTQGTAALAKGAARSPALRRLIFISSIGAICSGSDAIVTEATPNAPDSDYGRSKLEAENEVANTLHETPADWTILRPALVYGPGNPGNMLRLLKLVRTGLPLPFSSIRNRRSFIFVGNLVDAIAKSITAPAVARKVFNVSDSEVYSTPGLIRAIARVDSRTAMLLPFPAFGLRALGRVGDFAAKICRRSAGIDSYSIERLLGSLEVDNSGIRKAMNWTPPYTTEEGLAQTLGCGT